MATIGIIGGTGELGASIARGLLASGWPEERLWLSNRSGDRSGFEDRESVQITGSNADLVEASDLVVLSVPPARADAIGIDAGDRLVISVMAGITVERLAKISGAKRVVRAMSSPAAERGLAYSPWFAGPGVTSDDRAAVNAFFGACGLTDEVPEEGQIDLFTAMTGPVPGFVAEFAASIQAWAEGQGVASETAERAVRQLFLAAGTVMAEGKTPAQHVRAMIDYDGTTAAGLVAMKASPLAKAIKTGLDAAVGKARTIG